MGNLVGLITSLIVVTKLDAHIIFCCFGICLSQIQALWYMIETKVQGGIIQR